MEAVKGTLALLTQLNSEIVLRTTSDVSKTFGWDDIYAKGVTYALPLHRSHPLFYKFQDLIEGKPTIEVDETWEVVPRDIAGLGQLFIVTSKYEQSTSRYYRVYVIGKGWVYLWENEAYDSLGIVTDWDIQVRLNELYPNG